MTQIARKEKSLSIMQLFFASKCYIGASRHLVKELKKKQNEPLEANTSSFSVQLWVLLEICEINLLKKAMVLLIKQRKRQPRWDHAKPKLLN